MANPLAVIVAMGAVISWVASMQIAFYLFLGVTVWMFFEAASWLDSRWMRRSIDQLDEQALTDAAAILRETVDEVRNQVTDQKYLDPGNAA